MQLREFTNSAVWEYIVQEVLARIVLLCEENDNADPIKDPTLISRNQGGKNFGLWMVDLPKYMLEEALGREKNFREERQDGQDGRRD
jgi:hypothetical protein